MTPDYNEDEFLVFGRKLLQSAARKSPSFFTRNYWSEMAMEFIMNRPKLKLNLFRLVDVLPVLKNDHVIASHVFQYLSEIYPSLVPASQKLASYILPRSFRAWITARAVKMVVSMGARQFIAGNEPQAAIKALHKIRNAGMCFTVDLLGEYCVSEVEAECYLKRYLDAINILSQHAPAFPKLKPDLAEHRALGASGSVSVKLTALYANCSPLNFTQSVEILSARLDQIVEKAFRANIGIYIDAEDNGNNPIIYAVFKKVFAQKKYLNFPYPGIVVQAYAKDSEKIVNDLLSFAGQRGAPIAIRLVKGAYWDHETLISSQNHWPSPLFSIKESSDANFEHLSRILLNQHELCLPAFASHNLRSLAHACFYAKSKGISRNNFEIQVLYGMADPIAYAFAEEGYLVRFYMALGELIPGMGYLVRRLLENTSNESFLRQGVKKASDFDKLLVKPLLKE